MPLHSTGPALFYVGVGGSTRLPVFLGTCERPPDIHVRPYFRPVRSSDSGESADDVLFGGEEAFVFAELNYYRENVYRALQARPDDAVPRGLSLPRHIGTLLQRRGLTYKLWVVFSRVSQQALNPVLAGREGLLSGMPPGYRFWSAYLPQDRMGNLGTGTRRLSLMWHALRPPVRPARASGNAPAGLPSPRILYDHDMNGLPALTAAVNLR